MTCDNCGHPIDRKDAEKGVCLQCGAVLSYVLRAAEKAELVRRVVDQGGSVRILDDRIEAERRPHPIIETPAPRHRSGAGLVLIAWLTVLSVGVGVVSIGAFALHQPPARPKPGEPAQKPPIEAPPEVPTFVPPPIAESSSPAPTPTSAHSPRRGQPPASSVNAVIAAHRPAFAQCERAEVGRDPAAPRRYSLAITVGPSGKAEWFEVLSQASGTMKACLESVVRGLDFAKPSEGSTRSIVTLSLPSP